MSDELLRQLLTEVQDLKKSMATKEDLLGMATKEDLLRIATKEDLHSLKTEIKADLEYIVSEQQKDIISLLELMKSKMATKAAVEEIAAPQAEHARILSLLSARSIKQEAEIEHLKLAK